MLILICFLDVKILINRGKMECCNVEDMSHMFFGCNKFNQPLNNWDIIK